MKNVRSLFFLLVAILLSANMFSQSKSVLVKNNVAIFYPGNYVSANHSPSFALTETPKAIGNIPSDWKTKVNFSSAFGKSMAFIKIEEGTDLYGTGEVTGPLLRNGTVRLLWNKDNYTYARNHGENLYQSHPWVLGVRKDGSAFGVLADNTWRQSISLGDGILFTSDGPAFSVIIIEGASPQDVMESLASLTGKMDLPPLWSLGFQQCRWSYYPDSRVRQIADTFRLKQLPCDVIWMDIHYMNDYRIFTFSPERFPDPKATNDYLHSKGFKSVWMIDPGVKYEKGYFVYDSGTKLDVWVKNAQGKDFVGKVWPEDCVFPDFTQSKTAGWWAGLYKDFMARGVDGVWNDMNEPSVFDGVDGSMPTDNKHKGDREIKAGSHLRYHNVYGMLMTKASKEGILKANPDKRPFLLTRSNYIGGQRYAATWTGDNKASWEQLKMSVPMSITLGLSGQPFNGPDIGGFSGNSDKELFTHWIALGAFYPFSRAHKTQNSKNHELWSFGPETEQVAKIALERRYRLMPYIYTLFREASLNGMPVMRPVFFADPKNEKLRKEDQAFLLGGDLLVIPKWADSPVLPAGKWRSISLVGEDSKNDKYQPDIRIRPGAIIPAGEIIQNTTEFSTDIITLFVSPGEDNKAAGKMYVDAGDGFGYRKGEYAVLEFTSNANDKEAVIETRITEGKYPVTNKIIKVVYVTDSGLKAGESTSFGKVIVKL